MGDAIKDFFWKLSRSRAAKLTLLIVLVLGIVSLAGYVLFAGGKPKENATNTANVNAAPRMTARTLDGVLVPEEAANVGPICVVVENLVAARPQAGLSDAGVVYEMLAEGGITRFVAVFATGEDTPKIGPVRSARTPFLDVVGEYDCVFAHAGGSPDALAKINQYKVRDFNQFFNGQYFNRDEERKKRMAIEHTLFTSSDLLTRAVRDKGFPTEGSFDAWTFADDAPLASRPTEPKSITIDFSTYSYKVGYTYDRATNTYLRLQAEAAHDLENGKQVAAKNVVVQYVPTRLADKDGRLAMDLVGEGAGVLFHNGVATDMTWKKASREARTNFYDAEGAELTFTRGTTWVEIVPPDRDVAYN